MHVLIPHAHSLAEPAQALWPGLALPHTAALLGRLTRLPAETVPEAGECTLSAPQDRALARLLGLPGTDGRIPLAAWRRWHASGQPDDTPTALLTLCHWQVGTQRVALLPPVFLGLTPEEDLALRTTLADFFRDDGLSLAATGQPGRWFATGELLRELPCAALDRLLASEIDTRLLGDAPTPAARAVRRLQHETQMLLYTHPVNDAREARGAWPVNGFVLHGAGAWRPPPGYAPPPLEHARGAMPLVPPPHGTLLLIDTLRDAALQGDWQGWAQAWQALDAAFAQPAWQAAARQPGFQLTLCGSVRRQTWQTPRPETGWRGLLRRLPARQNPAADRAAIQDL